MALKHKFSKISLEDFDAKKDNNYLIGRVADTLEMPCKKVRSCLRQRGEGFDVNTAERIHRAMEYAIWTQNHIDAASMSNDA